MKKDFDYTGRDNLEVMASAKNYNDFLKSLVDNQIRRINSQKNKKVNLSVLDFGAGSGTYADLISQDHVSIDCLEPDIQLNQVLKRKGYKTYKNVNSLPTEKYDIIYSFNVFEHIEDDLGNAASLLESLKPGGSLIIYVPAFQILFSSMDKKVGHFRRYRLSRLAQIVSRNKLKTLQLTYCDPAGYFAALAYRFIGNSKGDISAKSVGIYDKLIFPISRSIEPATKRFFGKNALLIATKLEKNEKNK